MGKVHAKGFTVRLLWRQRPGDRKGERRHSQMYDSAIKAENDAFDFRYNLETKTCQEFIDAYKDNFRLSTNIISKGENERNVLTTYYLLKGLFLAIIIPIPASCTDIL